jgi:hypothetical protein
MNKGDMREWVSALEEVVDNKLTKWRKETRIENGEMVQIEWQFEQTHIILNIFWEDHKELVQVHYLGPHADHRFTWNGLSDKTFNKVMDRIGNLAQITQTPPIDPTD